MLLGASNPLHLENSTQHTALIRRNLLIAVIFCILTTTVTAIRSMTVFVITAQTLIGPLISVLEAGLDAHIPMMATENKV